MKFPFLSSRLYIWAAAYFLITTLIHWRLTIHISIIWYALGAIIGLHLLDLLEQFIFSAKTPLETSPLRSVVVQGVVTIVSLFVLSSTAYAIGAGVVLFLNMRLLELQYRQWQKTKSLASWFNSPSIPSQTQQRYMRLLIALFIAETFIFMVV